MKRIFSLLLTAAMLFALAAPVGAASTGYVLENVDAITLQADEAYTNTVRFTSADSSRVIPAFQAMIGAAGKNVGKPQNAAEVVRVIAESGGKNYTYILLRSAGRYYLARGSSCREIAYADFDKFMETVQWLYDFTANASFYKYGQPPLATSVYAGATRTWYGAPNHTFLGIDGKFHENPFEDDVDIQWIASDSTDVPIASFAVKPKSVTYSIYRENASPVWTGTEAEARRYALSQGDRYRIRVDAVYDTPYLRGTVPYWFHIDRGRRVRVTASGGDTHLGEAVVLKVEGTTAADPIATWTSDISFTRPPQFFRQPDGSQLMLFPVAYTNSAGEHWVEVSCAGETARYVINAKDRTWQRQDLTVDASTSAETIESQQANEEFEREISPIRGVADDTAHWKGRFILPCSDEKVTTQFGMVRYVNGQATSVRHGALDLAVPLGTPVAATGGGRVLYSGYLQLTGNTIVIEHGYGLKSWYYHMDTRKVQTGDRISQGQQIGTVGSTGFSTGPHLHFGMSVNNVFINPYTAINTDLFADLSR